MVIDFEIQDLCDVIIKVISCVICGLDLYLFYNFILGMLFGDIMGYEIMGEVVEVGLGVNGKLKKGDCIVVFFIIICGECDQCKCGNFLVCEIINCKWYFVDKVFGYVIVGLFGYIYFIGGYFGGQVEYFWVFYVDVIYIKVFLGIFDEQLLFLSDIFLMGWQGVV